MSSFQNLSVVPSPLKDPRYVLNFKSSFSGMSDLSKKIPLTRAISSMRHLFPNEYQFYPSSWFIPAQFDAFVEHCNGYEAQHGSSSHDAWYIVKPDDGMQMPCYHYTNHFIVAVIFYRNWTSVSSRGVSLCPLSFLCCKKKRILQRSPTTEVPGGISVLFSINTLLFFSLTKKNITESLTCTKLILTVGRVDLTHDKNKSRKKWKWSSRNEWC